MHLLESLESDFKYASELEKDFKVPFYVLRLKKIEIFIFYN